MCYEGWTSTWPPNSAFQPTSRACHGLASGCIMVGEQRGSVTRRAAHLAAERVHVRNTGQSSGSRTVANGAGIGHTERMNAPINIQGLSGEQKLELIAELWDSLTRDPTAVEIPEWHRQEIDRRLDRIAEHPGEGLSFDEVVESARKSLHRDK